MREIQTHSAPTYFAAANSGSGFRCFYDSVFRDVRRLYIIKGGPGTGKSRFMREAAGEALRRGERAELILCSSDPASLDGVIFPDRQIALADGTAPHVLEPVFPGSREELVNLGQFWKSDRLREQHDFLAGLAGQKAGHYAAAYRYLAAARSLEEEADALLAPAILQDKLDSAAARLIRTLPAPRAHRRDLRLTAAYSMDGPVRLDTLAALPGRKLILRDRCGIAHRFFAALEQQLAHRGANRLLSLDPLDPGRIDGIYFPDEAFALFAGEADQPEGRPLSTDRFLDRQKLAACRERLRFCRKCAAAMTEAACTSLAGAKEAHFALEKAYAAAMDFKKKEDFTRKFIAKLFQDQV